MKTIFDAVSKPLVVMVLFMMPLLFSCKGDKPQPFLNQGQMCDLLCEIRLAEAHLYQTRERNTQDANRVMLQRAMDVYVPIFQKYGIDYTQFQAIENYYMHHPRTMEKILKNVAEKLKNMQEAAKQETEQASSEQGQENS